MLRRRAAGGVSFTADRPDSKLQDKTIAQIERRSDLSRRRDVGVLSTLVGASEPLRGLGGQSPF